MRQVDLVLADVRPWGGAPTDILVTDGRIVGLGGEAVAADRRFEGGGTLALPGLFEGHTHLDKTFLGMPWRRNEGGAELWDKISGESRLKQNGEMAPARQSARQVVRSIAQGSTRIRGHTDVGTDWGLVGVESLLETRERYRDVVDIEIVAFPQTGLLISPGTAELMEEALRLGADVVGGLDPCGIDRDPKGHLDVVFGLAERFGRPVDIHLHEAGELGAFTMELIVERCRALAMGGRVTVSHAFCLGMPDRAAAARLVEQLAEAGIAIMTTGPASCAAPDVRMLTAAGVGVCSGSDGIRDFWSPYGTADMLERAMFIGLRNDFERDDDLELALRICSEDGARALGCDRLGLNEGRDADIVLVDAETVAEAIVNHPPRRAVFKRGRLVAEHGSAMVEAP